MPAQAGTTYILHKHIRVPWAMLVKVTPQSSVELTYDAPTYTNKINIELTYTMSGNRCVNIVWSEHHSLTMKVLLTQTSATLCFVLGFVCSC